MLGMFSRRFRLVLAEGLNEFALLSADGTIRRCVALLELRAEEVSYVFTLLVRGGKGDRERCIRPLKEARKLGERPCRGKRDS